MKLNDDHYENFKVSNLNPTSWSGRSPANWFSWVRNQNNINYSPYLQSETLSKNKISRSDLFNMVNDLKLDTLSICISILAWGGMNLQHGTKALSTFKNWIQVAEDIRKGVLDRGDAYEKFAVLRKNSLLPGMGPAYFTKLIFFLIPISKSRGFIMDQWTSASINLLFDSKIIKTHVQIIQQKNGAVKLAETVSDNNSKKNYILFCECIELIASDLVKDPAYIEEIMFSEGRGKGIWRNYVVKQREFNVSGNNQIISSLKEEKITSFKKTLSKDLKSDFLEQPLTKLICYPLSGRGNQIKYSGSLEKGFICMWGGQDIKFSSNLLQDLLNNFRGMNEFKLGAERMGTGGAGSLGVWLKDEHTICPQNASLLGAILVNEGLFTARGKKPIYLSFKYFIC